MKNRPVPATDLISDRQTVAIGNMQNRSILDIRFRAYLNLIDVCSHYALKPDAGPRTDGDFTEDGGVRRYEHIVRKNGTCAQEPIEALENLVKIHKNKINALTKSSEYCENDKISSVRARPGLDTRFQSPRSHGKRIVIMNKVALVESVQKQLGGEISKAEAERAVTAVVNAVKVGVKKDKIVQLVGFGTFKVVERKARKGVNPKTKQPIRIPKSKTVKFVPGKDFKSKV